MESEVKTKQLRESTDERLAELESSLRREIFESRIKNFTNQLDDTASIRRARKDLARVKTLLNERAAGAVERPADGEAAGGTETNG
jgi:large subunit ribosomal protein L29